MNFTVSLVRSFRSTDWRVLTSIPSFTLQQSVLVLEKAMATHSSTLAWKIPWTEAWWAAVYGVAHSWTRLNEWVHFHFSLSCIGEGNGNPLQCSCLENPRDGEAWWAAISGVAQSRTRRKRLSSSSSSACFTFFLSCPFSFFSIPSHLLPDFLFSV